MTSKAPVPRLMCLVSSRDDLALLPALIGAGVDCFQVRDKVLDTSALVDLTRRVMTAGVPTIVNDRLDVALAAGAAGVHLGADDMPVAEARGRAPEMLIGATARTAAAIAAAAAAGADYVGVGPVFPTTSKSDAKDPLGLAGLAAAAAGSPVPVIAIGGIDRSRVVDVVAAGIHGVAVIGGIWNASDPVAAAAALAAAVRA